MLDAILHSERWAYEPRFVLAMAIVAIACVLPAWVQCHRLGMP